MSIITCKKESLLFADRTDTWSDSKAILDFFELNPGKQQSPRYHRKTTKQITVGEREGVGGDGKRI